MHTFELGSLANFERRGLEPAVLNLPLPAEEPNDELANGPTYRLFDYRDGASAIVFLLMLVLLVALPLTRRPVRRLHRRARARGRPSPAARRRLGRARRPGVGDHARLVNALLQDTLFGHAQGESVFGIVLVFGALVGALGGYLAAGASRSSAAA